MFETAAATSSLRRDPHGNRDVVVASALPAHRPRRAVRWGWGEVRRRGVVTAYKVWMMYVKGGMRYLHSDLCMELIHLGSQKGFFPLCCLCFFFGEEVDVLSHFYCAWGVINFHIWLEERTHNPAWLGERRHRRCVYILKACLEDKSCDTRTT